MKKINSKPQSYIIVLNTVTVLKYSDVIVMAAIARDSLSCTVWELQELILHENTLQK